MRAMSADYSCSRRLILDCSNASQSDAFLSIPLIYPILPGTASRPLPKADALALVRQRLWQCATFSTV